MPSASRSFEFYLKVLQESVIRFFDRDMPMHAAALSYYMTMNPRCLIRMSRSGDKQVYRFVIYARLRSMILSSIDKFAFQVLCKVRIRVIIAVNSGFSPCLENSHVKF